MSGSGCLSALLGWLHGGLDAVHGHETGDTLAIGGALIVAGAVVLAAYWLGIVALNDLLPSVCGVACLAMIGAMLFRVRLYSGQHAHAE